MTAVFPAGSGQKPFTYPNGFLKCQDIEGGGNKTKLGEGKIEACSELS